MAEPCSTTNRRLATASRPAICAWASLVLVAAGIQGGPVLAQPAGQPSPNATGAAGAPPVSPGGNARAASPAPPAAGADEVDPLTRAKELFRQGNQLRKAGDFERALDYFMRSRQLVPSPPNTTNAAICLSRLGRFDEALELYELLLTEFGQSMGTDRRVAVGRAMATLRGQVGSIDVQANVSGSLVVDGRARGAVPLVHPVRVMPGIHVVQVLADGYRGVAETVDVAVAKTIVVQMSLTPLSIAGRMRIEDPALAGAKVYVDGAEVGKAPWEGTLSPGHHYYFVRRGEMGSAPRNVTVVEGQAIVVTTPLASLGPELRLTTKPPTALLRIGDVPVGTGSWQGRLPVGQHEVVAREDGYVETNRSLKVQPGMSTDISVALTVDESHPRWGVDSGRFWVDAFGGPLFAPALGSGVEESCNAYQCEQNLGVGYLIGAVGGYEFPVGLSLELSAGYLRARKTVDRSYSETGLLGGDATRQIQWNLADALQYSGPFVAGGLGYRLPFADIAEFRADVLAGAHFPFARYFVSGTASAEGITADAVPSHNNLEVQSANFLVMPHVGLGLRFGGFGLGLGFAAAILVTSGPDFDTVQMGPGGGCDTTVDPNALGCGQLTTSASPGRTYGPMVMLLPRATIGWLFD